MGRRLRQMADLIVNPNRFWRETVQETREAVQQAMDVARAGRPGLAAFMLTILVVGGLIVLAVIVLSVADLF